MARNRISVQLLLGHLVVLETVHGAVRRLLKKSRIAPLNVIIINNFMIVITFVLQKTANMMQRWISSFGTTTGDLHNALHYVALDCQHNQLIHILSRHAGRIVLERGVAVDIFMDIFHTCFPIEGRLRLHSAEVCVILSHVLQWFCERNV